MTTKPVVLALALLSLVFAILMPPEAYPSGTMAVVIAATFCFLITLGERKIPNRYVLGGMAVFLLLLAHSFWVSVDWYRSLEFMAVLWTYYCLVGFFIYAGFGSIQYVAGTAVALSLIVSIYGCYQYFWGLEQLYEFVTYSGSSSIMKLPVPGGNTPSRVFSTLALPGTLWGFIVVALPLHAVLWRRHRLLDALLVISAGLLLTTGFLTRSFGFLAGLALLSAGWALVHKKFTWNRLAVLLVMLIAGGGLFYSVRREAIEIANPFLLRFKDFVSAWNIFVAHPFGTGLNTYGVVYPQYMLAGANENQYAHNTPLQIMAELGYAAVLAGLAAAILLFRSKRLRGLDRDRSYVLLALIVWMAHNLIDINVYFASLGVFGAILIGLIFSRPPAQDVVNYKPATAAFAVVAIAVVIFSGVAFLSNELQYRAKFEYDNSGPLVAIKTLELAKKINPMNSSLFQDSGDLLLYVYARSKNPEYLKAATASFQTAMDLSPYKAGPRIGLSLCYSNANDMDSALKQIRIARDLYPTSNQVQAIIRLMEKRVASGS